MIICDCGSKVLALPHFPSYSFSLNPFLNYPISNYILISENIGDTEYLAVAKMHLILSTSINGYFSYSSCNSISPAATYFLMVVYAKHNEIPKWEIKVALLCPSYTY